MTNWLTYEFGKFIQTLPGDPIPKWQSEGTVDIDPNCVVAIGDDIKTRDLLPKLAIIFLSDGRQWMVPKSRDQVRHEVISARDD